MMTYIAFKESTAKIRGGTRGSKMIKVDLALLDWWQHYFTPDPRRKIELTVTLFKQCKDWLKVKVAKKEVSFFGTIKELLLRRRTAVSKLAQDALNELIGLDPENVALFAFDRAKVKSLALGT